MLHLGDNKLGNKKSIAKDILGNEKMEERMYPLPLISNQNLKVLNLPNCHIQGPYAKSLFAALQTNNALLSVDISYNPFSDVGATGVADFLETNKSLTNLDLSQCVISPKGAEALGKAIKLNTTLKIFFLGDNILGDDGCVYIANGIGENNSIEELNLRICRIGDVGALRMAAILAAKVRRVIRVLWMSHNYIRDDAAKALCHAVMIHKMETFSIKMNRIEDMEANMECMEYLEKGCSKGFCMGGSGQFKEMYCDPSTYVKHSPQAGNTPRRTRPVRAKSPLANNQIRPLSRLEQPSPSTQPNTALTPPREPEPRISTTSPKGPPPPRSSIP